MGKNFFFVVFAIVLLLALVVFSYEWSHETKKAADEGGAQQQTSPSRTAQIYQVEGTNKHIIKFDDANTEEEQQAYKKELSEEMKQALDVPAPSSVSHWRMYRNEKYGFEIKLPDSYDGVMNLKNRIGVVNGVVSLDTGKSNYTFFTNRDISMEYSSSVELSIFDYSEDFDSDFENWILKTHSDVSLSNSIGSLTLQNGQKIRYFCTAAELPYCAALITDNKSIVEIYSSQGDRDIPAYLSTLRYYQ